MRAGSAWQIMVVVSVISGCNCASEGSPDASDAGGSQDAGDVDAGTPDAGAADAGLEDAGLEDAGFEDAGLEDAGLDAGLEDAGLEDAGLEDAGLDAGLDAGQATDAGVPDAGDQSDAGRPDAGWLDAGVVRWTALAPPAVRRGGMTWDPTRQRVVRFGGLVGETTVADLWTWDGARWAELRTPAWPPTRQQPGLTYDTLRNRLFLFGGVTPDPAYATPLFRPDTWVLDGGAWVDVTDNISLGILSRGSLTWDPVHEQVLFIGVDGLSWLYSDGWRQGASVASEISLVTWDRARSQAVALSSAAGFLQTWTSVWSGDAGSTWDTSTPTVHPPGFLSGAIAYDPVRLRVVAVVPRSQQTNPGGELAETWEWDGLAWVSVTSAVEPSVGSEFAMAYDEARNRMVLTGGLDLWGDTWERVGTQWQRVEERPRGPDSFAFDERRGRMVTFGGASHTPDGGSTVCTNDTWEWSNDRWERKLASVSPAPRCGSALAWDPVSERVILFGGVSSSGTHLQDTWSWDGTAWTQLAPPTFPPARSFAAMAFDEGAQRLVLLAGMDPVDRNDLWEFDGLTWRSAAAPPVLGPVSMAWDSSRSQLIVVDDGMTWTRADGGWASFSGTPFPPSNHRPGFSNDPVRGRVVMHFWDWYSPQTWEWDGRSWSRRVVAPAPAAPFGALAWDGAQGRMMMFGNGTWFYDP